MRVSKDDFIFPWCSSLVGGILNILVGGDDLDVVNPEVTLLLVVLGGGKPPVARSGREALLVVGLDVAAAHLGSVLWL